MGPTDLDWITRVFHKYISTVLWKRGRSGKYGNLGTESGCRAAIAYEDDGFELTVRRDYRFLDIVLTQIATDASAAGQKK